MELKHVHALIDAEPVVDVLHEGAHDGGQEANHGGEPDAHVARRRGNAHEPGNGPLAGADDGEAALVLEVVDSDLFSNHL